MLPSSVPLDPCHCRRLHPSQQPVIYASVCIYIKCEVCPQSLRAAPARLILPGGDAVFGAQTQLVTLRPVRLVRHSPSTVFTLQVAAADPDRACPTEAARLGTTRRGLE